MTGEGELRAGRLQAITRKPTIEGCAATGTTTNTRQTRSEGERGAKTRQRPQMGEMARREAGGGDGGTDAVRKRTETI